MTILHYTLGLSPHRSGGLTKYAADLSQEHSSSHHVVMLYPCGWRWWSREIYTKEVKKIGEVRVIELKNSLPIPLFHGTRSPRDFISSRSMSLLEMQRLYEITTPDVVHLHTLMGLPQELLIFLKHKGVKIVFTSHDYFGICPRVNLVDHNNEICHAPSPERCSRCNTHSLPTLSLRLRESWLAQFIKKIVGRYDKK